MDFKNTADGHPAARVAHITFAMIPGDDGSLYKAECFPARDPAELTASAFHKAGYMQVADEREFRDEVERFAKERADIAALGRRDLSKDQIRDLACAGDWGPVDYGKTYADGVVMLNTAEHGGIVLSPERNALVHEAWRSGRVDGHGCYEEDQQWAIVALTFPELFAPHEIASAERTMINDDPDAYEIATGRSIPVGASAARRRDEFMAANAGRLMGVAAVKHPTDASKVVVTATVDANRDALHRARRFVVDAALYASEFGGIQFLVDTGRDVEVDRDLAPLAA